MVEDRKHDNALLRELKWKREQVEATCHELELQLAEAKETLTAIDLLIVKVTPVSEIHEVGVSLNGVEAGHGSLPEAHEEEEESDVLVCGNATVDDIVNCKTQRECLYVIASKNDSNLDLNPAADLVIAAGKSQGMRSTVVSTLHHFMSNSDDWEWVSPSQFRLVTDSRSDGSSSDGPVDQGESELIGETLCSELTEIIEQGPKHAPESYSGDG